MKLLRRALGALLALLILFEEWGWEPLQQALARLGRLPPVAALERWIGSLPPRAALALFVLPSLALIPVKLAALWLIGQGRPLLGLAVIVLAKLLGTALVARLFALTRPALLQMPRFARGYGRWLGWKEALLAQFRASRGWRTVRALRRLARQRWARWWRQS